MAIIDDVRQYREDRSASAAGTGRDELIALIYESALLSDAWDRLPDEIARRLGAGTGVLCRRGAWLGMVSLTDGAVRCVIGGVGSGEWTLQLDRFECSLRAAEARGLLAQLVPHLNRAVAIAQQQMLQRSRLTVAALDRIGSGAAVIDDVGRVLAANRLFATQFGTSAAEGCDLTTRLEWHRDTISLRATLTDAIERDRRAVVPIRDGTGCCIAALHLVPFADLASSKRQGTILALIARPNSGMLPELILLQSLFGLTRAEARLARGIAAGLSLEAIAQDSGIKLETARSHIKRVFSKTCTSRQIELTLLIRGFAFQGADDTLTV